MYCDVQPESRKGAPDDTAREIEKLFDSLSVFPIHNLNISLLSSFSDPRQKEKKLRQSIRETDGLEEWKLK